MKSKASAITTIRENLNLSKKKFGELVGVHPYEICKIEKNKREPTMDHVIMIAKRAGVKVEVTAVIGEKSFSIEAGRR
jgi:transcriptional regulator with XRE-family HTH domain